MNMYLIVLPYSELIPGSYLEVCAHYCQLVIGVSCPLVCSVQVGCQGGSIGLVLPLQCQQGALPLLALLQLPAQVQNAVVKLLQCHRLFQSW